MNKNLLFAAAAALVSASVSANSVTLTFNRTGAVVDSVTVISDDESVSARLLAIEPSGVELRTDGTAIDETVLGVLQQRTDLATGEYIGWTFSISGLPAGSTVQSHEVVFNFFNVSGTRQTQNDSGDRQMIPSVWTGTDADNLEELVNLGADNMYASGATISNNKLQKNYEFASDEAYTVPDEGYVLSVHLAKVEGGVGCFYGISQVVINYELPVDSELTDYLTESLAGLKNCPGIFDPELVANIADMDLTSFADVDAGKAAIDAEIEKLYAQLNGKTCTLHNVFHQSTAGTEHYFFLSANTGTHASGISEVMDNQTEWTLIHLQGNSFNLKNGNLYIASAGEVTTASTGPGPDVELEEDPETPAVFEIEPYAHEDYSESNTVALKCSDMTDANAPANGARVYIQFPANFTQEATAVDNMTCKYYYNTKDTDVTHGSAQKGAWVMTLIETGSTSAIEEVAAASEAAAGAVYDILGRRLSAPVRGINIIDGRKVLVR